jgi:phospholipase C
LQRPTYSGTASGGTLTVTDGSHTANIALLGNYTASTFVTSSDGHGGTNVVDPPPGQFINHVIVLCQENHSFDQYFGSYPGLPAGFGIPPGFTQPNGSGGLVAPFHSTNLTPSDPDHQWAAIHSEWDQGKMDGFYTTDGINSMGYYTASELPYYYSLLSNYTLCADYFCGLLGGSLPNKLVLYSGTSGGNTSNNIANGTLNYPSVLDLLSQNGRTFANYNFNTPDNYSSLALFQNWATGGPNNVLNQSQNQFFTDCTDNTLPQVAFIQDLDPTYDEHPPGNIQTGMGLMQSIITAVQNSPAWASTAILLTYDEAGGFFDHVPPPQLDAYGPGIRVPMLIISPYAKPGYVDTTFSDPGSVLKFIETVFGLPTLASINHQFDTSTPTTNNDTGGAPFPPRDGNPATSDLMQDFTFPANAPVLSNVAVSASYSAGGTATTLSSGTTVSDPESANLVSGTVSISSGTFLTGDTLAAVTTGTSITASYNTSTGVLSLTGSDTLAHYQQVLDSFSYSSSSQNPTNSGADPSRTVSWVVNDGTLNSATQTTTINITGGTPSGADTGTAHGGVASVTGPNPPATARSFDGVAGSYISLASSPFDWNSGPYSVCGRIYVIPRFHR